MTRWEEDEFTANDLLLDRELIDSRGMPCPAPATRAPMAVAVAHGNSAS
jgi:hypothetical protein